jgi:hypothetical protein
MLEITQLNSPSKFDATTNMLKVSVSSSEISPSSQEPDIGELINLAVALSDGKTKQLIKEYGRRVAAQMLVDAEKKARGTYVEVRRRRRLREISPLQARAWREAAESDALVHGKRQLPLQRSGQDREDHEAMIRKQKDDAMGRAVAIAIENYLVKRTEATK